MGGALDKSSISCWKTRNKSRRRIFYSHSTASIYLCESSAKELRESKTQTSASAHCLKIAGVGQKNVSRASIDFHANLAAIVPELMANKTQQGRQKSQCERETVIVLKEISHLRLRVYLNCADVRFSCDELSKKQLNYGCVVPF
jgi:hypothetical protein